MFLKKLLLTALSLVLVLIYFKSDFYGEWYESHIYVAREQLDIQLAHMSLEDRKIMRYGNSYVICRQVEAYLQQQHAVNPLILMPPNDYIKHLGKIDFYVAEPVVFYYHTGLRSAWLTSKNVNEADWALYVGDDGQPRMVPLDDSTVRRQIMDTYKPYKATL